MDTATTAEAATEEIVSRLRTLIERAWRRLEREPLPQDRAAALTFVAQQPATWGRPLLWRHLRNADHLLHDLNTALSDALAHRAALAARLEQCERTLRDRPAPLDSPEAVRAREAVEHELPELDHAIDRLREPIRDAERLAPLLTVHVGCAVREALRLDREEAAARIAAAVADARAALDAARAVLHEHADVEARWQEIVGPFTFDVAVTFPTISVREPVTEPAS